MSVGCIRKTEKPLPRIVELYKGDRSVSVAMVTENPEWMPLTAGTVELANGPYFYRISVGDDSRKGIVLLTSEDTRIYFK